MSSKQLHATGTNDLDRLRHQNHVFHEEFLNRRDETERTSRSQIPQSIQTLSKHETTKPNNFTNHLVEQKAQLKESISGFQGLPGVSNSRNFGGNELESLRRRLDSMHRDLMACSLMSNLKGKKQFSQDDVHVLTSNFKRILTELQRLHVILAGNTDTMNNNAPLYRNPGPRTSGSPSVNQLICNIDDLVYLAGPVTENALLTVLEDRLWSGHCLTRLGPVVLSVNGYNSLQEQSDMVWLQSSVRQAVDRLMARGIQQAFVLSGCSGSGKTFRSQSLARLILDQGHGGLESDVSKHFLSSVTVLHSLGKTKTLSNSDSSRAGYLYEFHFSDGNITKTRIQTYQLDTTRVTNPPAGERNYHIFYEMLSGITQDERAKLHLQGYSFYNLNYLSECPPSNENEEIEWKTKFERWRAGLSTLGIPFPDVMRILAAILLLGNVQFVEGEGLELDVKGNNEIKAVAALLGVSGVSLYRGLTTKTKNLRGQVFRSLCEPAAANGNRDSLSMALYSRTMSAIARRVNSFKRPTSSTVTTNSTQGMGEVGMPSVLTNGILGSPQGSPGVSPVWPTTNGFQPSSKSASGLIAVMDMFGFENTKVNRLEQMCINLCSETLQHFYNTHIFKSSEEYCREEDIFNDLDIDYDDNAECIELMTCQRAGIFTLLDAETIFPRGTSDSFLEKLRLEHQNTPCFYDPDPVSSCFAVSHHAGNVVYDAQNLVDINRDSIPDDIVCIFSRQNCNFGFASHLFTSDLKTAQGQTAAPRGVPHRISPSSLQENNSIQGSFDSTLTTFSQDFQGKLDHLLKTLVQAEPTFIRCVKTNSLEQPNMFDRQVVSQQLKALQVFETVQLLQSEVAHHCRFDAFVNKYGSLSTRPLGCVMETAPEDCAAIIESLPEAYNWILGDKYVFYSDQIQQELDRRLGKDHQSAVIVIQAAVRGWLCRKHWKNLKRSLEMQKKARHHNKSNQKHISNRHITSSQQELSVDTKTAEQMCCLYGLDMETPPPLPKSRPYTVMGNRKMGFPQTRIMKQDLKDGDGQLLLRKGEQVLVVGAARKRGYLLVEHRSGTNIQVPFQITELKVSPHSSPR